MESRKIERSSIDGIVADLSMALDSGTQDRLKQELQRFPDKLAAATFTALRNNPFLELSSNEINDLEMRRRIGSAEQELLLLRQQAARITGVRVAVFAMPKSGSSFVQSAIAHATGLPFVSLTSIPAGGGGISSAFGMNGREQELDELALVTQTFRGRGRWVAQHHTRFTPYLGRQLRFYRITPIVTIRNVFDAIVSMDDMIMGWRTDGGWESDPPHALPLDYPSLSQADRLELLAEDFGVWLIKFLVSWKRAIAARLTYPLILSYEDDILQPGALAARLGDYLGFGDHERERLDSYFDRAPGREARFNKGVSGRGAAVPREARKMLERYAQRFRADLGNDGMHYLFGDTD